MWKGGLESVSWVEAPLCDRSGCFMAVANAGREFARRVGNRPVDTAGNRVACDLGNPEVDVIEPRGGLAEYDDMEGLARRGQSVDGTMLKAPLAQQPVGPSPTGRG